MKELILNFVCVIKDFLMPCNNSFVAFTVLRFYLLVFLTLVTLLRYCAHFVGGSTWIPLQLVQELMEPKPIVELHAIYPADEQ